VKATVKHLGTIVSLLRGALPKRTIKERPEDPVPTDNDSKVSQATTT
jgi:hypothetical protein